ncbi:MAG: HlyD family efflux transporter periplasmic adaptor subunit [Marinagarivorans sp.]|nr:HlyD family efflux transporter periplasmic adaptor subunit [Marinagarivorans sp.]
MKTFIPHFIPVLITVVLASPSLLAAEDHDHDDHGHAHNSEQNHTNTASHEQTDCVREAEVHEHGHEEHGHEEDEEHEGHGGEHDEHDEHDEDGHAESKASCIAGDIAEQVGIITALSGPQVLHPSIRVYGEFNTGAEQLSHIRARFDGLIKTVKGNVGDEVQEGDLLAEVESNDSLKLYAVKAPISGKILERHASKGEVTREQVLFTIANLETLWADLRIFPSQLAQVKAGQTVTILLDSTTITGVIDHIVPALNQPYALARLSLSNSDNQLTPNQWLEARIQVAELAVPLAVTQNALQTLEGKTGVFIKQGNNYVFTPLSLGRRDDTFVEVLAGLSANTEYVSQNSYLVKADIEKSAAGHDH